MTAEQIISDRAIEILDGDRCPRCGYPWYEDGHGEPERRCRYCLHIRPQELQERTPCQR